MHKVEIVRAVEAGRRNTGPEGTGRFANPLSYFERRLQASEAAMKKTAAAEAAKPLAQRTFATPAEAEI